VIGVLDLDSPLLSRFDEADAAGIETLARIWVEPATAFDGLFRRSVLAFWKKEAAVD